MIAYNIFQKRYPIIWAVVFLIQSAVCKKAVYWEAEPPIFIQGAEVRLKCRGTKCTISEPNLWRGGIQYNVLATEYESRNPYKYEIIVKADGSDLVIKNIGIADLNCNYTCNCGFHQFTKELSAKRFLHPPDTDSHSIERNDHEYHIAVTISKVYPKPSSCYRTLNVPNKHNKSDLEIIPILENEPFYKLEVHTVVNCFDKKSKIDVVIVCVVKNTDFNVFRKTIDCYQGGDRGNIYIAVIAGVFSSVTVVIVCVVFVWKFRKKKNTINGRTNNTNDERGCQTSLEIYSSDEEI